MSLKRRKKVAIDKASFKCEKAILDEFRALVAQKYGKLWGVLSQEFTEALRKHSERLREEIEKGEIGKERKK
jgi:hypothetical protein